LGPLLLDAWTIDLGNWTWLELMDRADEYPNNLTVVPLKA